MAKEKPIEIEDKRSRNFTIIENEIIDTAKLTPTEKLIYIILCRFAYHNKCHPSTATIAELAGVSRRSVFRALKKLCSLGLVKKQQRRDKEHGNTSNVYTVVGHSGKVTPCDKLTQACDNMTQACDTESQALCHDVISLMTPETHEEYISEEYISEEYYTNVSHDSKTPSPKDPQKKKPEHKVVGYLYGKFKELGVKKSQNWFKKQIGIARQLLARYPPEGIMEAIDFAFQDSFWKGAFTGLEHFESVLQKKVALKGAKDTKEGGDPDGGDEIDRLLRERTKRYIEKGVF